MEMRSSFSSFKYGHKWHFNDIILATFDTLKTLEMCECLQMKRSDAKASKCNLKFSSKISFSSQALVCRFSNFNLMAMNRFFPLSLK